jgi:hypothetical protein
MFAFSERVRGVLKAAGWVEGGLVDIQDSLLYLTASGYSPSAAAASVLHELNGLTCQLSYGNFYMDVKRANLFLAPDDRPYLDALIGEPLCPFGGGCQLIALIAPSGKVVLLHDEWDDFFTADTLPAALDRLFFPDPQDTWFKITPDQQPPGYQVEPREG